MFNNMGGKLIFGVLSGFVLLLSSVIADNQVSNGDFSAGYLANVSQCKYDGGFLGFFPVCSALFNSTTNYLQPNGWVINYSFDAVHISSQPTYSNTIANNPHIIPGTQVLHLNLYTISEGGLYDNNANGYCGYSRPNVCSSTTAGGNETFNPYILQNVTLANNSYALTFQYWTPYTPAIFTLSGGGSVYDASPDTARSPDGRFYNCYATSDGLAGSNIVNNVCQRSSLFHVQLTKTDHTVIFDLPLSSLPSGGISNASIDLSQYSAITSNNYTLAFYLSGTGANTSANGVDLANVILAAETFPSPSTVGINLISDTNTMTGIGVDNWTAVTVGRTVSSLDANTVSRNFSDFYKYYFRFTESDNNLGNSIGQNFIVKGYDSSNNQYVLDNHAADGTNPNANPVTANNSEAVYGVGNTSLAFFGYAPFNITLLSFHVQSDNPATISIDINVTINNITLANRHHWIFPVANVGGDVYQAYPLLFYGFNYNQATSNITFTAYNFRNSSSFGNSLSSSEGTASDNFYLLDGSNNLLASDTNAKTYATEYTSDYTNILANNGGVVGDFIVANRTSRFPFWNSTSAVPTTKFSVVIFNPSFPGGVAPGASLDVNSLFNGLLGFTTGWNPSLLLMIWISISMAVSFTLIYYTGLKVPSMSNFQSLFLAFGIIFMAGTFIGFVPVWFWGFVILFVIVLGVKQFMGERQ